MNESREIMVQSAVRSAAINAQGKHIAVKTLLDEAKQILDWQISNMNDAPKYHDKRGDYALQLIEDSKFGEEYVWDWLRENTTKSLHPDEQFKKMKK